ncbi:hypothetical protein B0A50_05986 [Salinomyces thailandicus]|uniref:Uncharacterized protein n=1 Tax=Salinomyces thailandicus TaxID=706561 RepID=A0A4U0TQU6_9PEZI|nr:hypothetical protein B0A50_05986 [Salinomyces thailandica]
MKAGLLTIAALSALAVAQPHRPGHRHLHGKREVVTETVMATATAPHAVVYVDGNGNPMYTSYDNGRKYSHPTPNSHARPWAEENTSAAPEETTEAAPAPEPTSETSNYVAPAPEPTSETSSYVAPAPEPTSETSSYVAPAPEPTSETSSDVAPSPTTEAPAPSSTTSETSAAPAPTTTSTNSGSSGLSITYSPYNSDNSCKDQDQINMDMAQLSGYSMVRTYGTDCNQTATILNAARANGMKLFAGIYDISNVNSEIDNIVDATNGDWSDIHTIAVGNEGVNNGQYSVDDVVSALGAARSKLSAVGYSGPIVTVDTFVAMIANPQLCQASDYAAANCHAFFDGTITAQDAGKFVVAQAQRVSEACGGMNTMITESGWPSQGESNGVAVPSEENQKAAISSLKDAFSDNLILFTAYNDMWKQNNAGTYGAEQYWGMYGNAPSD